ncbi:cytochrome C oxidase subunit II [Aquibacillus salsiterrae]|uniref:Cytochrome C oxidase subunit II n=1 Tax=Aquibacillus salsiterrae TaxID=2950439 RepID=A0A9X4AG84_9BACI|nr:cytochrome C oxidase subunit II [Aquibacillus salsiterrae]MDC3417010.1 cytochrome C oxidase subunit II [Aquibacillus salsiterrae]
MKKFIYPVLIIGFVLVLSACGGGSSTEDESANEGTRSQSESSGNTLDITATNWEFDQENYSTTAGEVTINLTNKDGVHGVKVDGTGLNIQGDGSGKVTLEPGEYTIRCTVPCGTGHASMQSTITVS